MLSRVFTLRPLRTSSRAGGTPRWQNGRHYFLSREPTPLDGEGQGSALRVDWRDRVSSVSLEVKGQGEARPVIWSSRISCLAKLVVTGFVLYLLMTMTKQNHKHRHAIKKKANKTVKKKNKGGRWGGKKERNRSGFDRVYS